eukprot:TRINITY_DN76313_c0_g1_i1.p1 TRINITY_DN76313_c0_g1~~TRINITY_DN76313_c0_g1_i1.p1  ORF type:complete len:254 (-),score=15.05 TRINITY_DN76313_c0_g1_i1:244-969(-)
MASSWLLLLLLYSQGSWPFVDASESLRGSNNSKDVTVLAATIGTCSGSNQPCCCPSKGKYCAGDIFGTIEDNKLSFAGTFSVEFDGITACGLPSETQPHAVPASYAGVQPGISHWFRVLASRRTSPEVADLFNTGLQASNVLGLLVPEVVLPGALSFAVIGTLHLGLGANTCIWNLPDMHIGQGRHDGTYMWWMGASYCTHPPDSRSLVCNPPGYPGTLLTFSDPNLPNNPDRFLLDGPEC